jgi:large subunit ribosomal protein L17e
VQVRYAATSIDGAKSARARGSYLRVSFKNTRETAQAINGWKLERALTYLGNVLEHKEAIPMRRYAGGTGRTAQGELQCLGYNGTARGGIPWHWSNRSVRQYPKTG